jgi:hypothetical protein
MIGVTEEYLLGFDPMDRRDFPPDDPLYRAAGELTGWLDLEESGYRDGCPLSVVMDGLGFKGERSGLGGSSVVRDVVMCGDILRFNVVDNHSDFDVSRALAERLGVDISVEVSRSYVERGGLVWTTGPERFTARNPAALRRRIEDVIRRTVDLIGRPGEELEFGMFAPFRGMLIGSLGPGPDVVNLISDGIPLEDGTTRAVVRVGEMKDTGELERLLGLLESNYSHFTIGMGLDRLHAGDFDIAARRERTRVHPRRRGRRDTGIKR